MRFPRRPHVPVLRAFLATVVVSVAAATSLAACATGPRITFIPDGRTYTSEEVLARSDDVDLGAASDLTAEEAPEARQRALAALRRQEGSASAFADLLTRVFPADTRSVPVLVEAALVDGHATWIVVEAWGGREGLLDRRRVWVLDRESGEVISSATRP